MKSKNYKLYFTALLLLISIHPLFSNEPVNVFSLVTPNEHSTLNRLHREYKSNPSFYKKYDTETLHYYVHLLEKRIKIFQDSFLHREYIVQEQKKLTSLGFSSMGLCIAAGLFAGLLDISRYNPKDILYTLILPLSCFAPIGITIGGSLFYCSFYLPRTISERLELDIKIHALLKQQQPDNLKFIE